MIALDDENNHLPVILVTISINCEIYYANVTFYTYATLDC